MERRLSCRRTGGVRGDGVPTLHFPPLHLPATEFSVTAKSRRQESRLSQWAARKPLPVGRQESRLPIPFPRRFLLPPLAHEVLDVSPALPALETRQKIGRSHALPMIAPEFRHPVKQRLGPRQSLPRKRSQPPGQSFAPAQELRVRYDFIDQTQLEGTRRVDLLASQEQPAGSGSTQQIDRPPQRPGRRPSQFHLGKAEHGAPSRDPKVVVEGDLKTAPRA